MCQFLYLASLRLERYDPLPSYSHQGSFSATVPFQYHSAPRLEVLYAPILRVTAPARKVTANWMFPLL